MSIEGYPLPESAHAPPSFLVSHKSRSVNYVIPLGSIMSMTYDHRLDYAPENPGMISPCRLILYRLFDPSLLESSISSTQIVFFSSRLYLSIQTVSLLFYIDCSIQIVYLSSRLYLHPPYTPSPYRLSSSLQIVLSRLQGLKAGGGLTTKNVVL